MIIAVQRGMSSIKGQLENKGYKVVYNDEYNHPVDVLIHNGKADAHPFSYSSGYDSSGYDLSNNMMHSSSHFSPIMKINANGKNIKDIEMMLFSKRHNGTQIL